MRKPLGTGKGDKPPANATAKKREANPTKFTEKLQAGSAAGLLALAAFGYLYTVRPTYQKQLLQEEVAELKTKMERYTRSLEPYVIKQFLEKVLSDAERFKCGPTVWDVGARTRPPPLPRTGVSIVDANFKGAEFALLPQKDREKLIGSIQDFLKRRDAAAGLASTLEIQHRVYLTGPLAAVQSHRNLFRFTRAESARQELVFKAFDRSMTALKVYLLPPEKGALKSRPCANLGVAPE